MTEKEDIFYCEDCEHSKPISYPLEGYEEILSDITCDIDGERHGAKDPALDCPDFTPKDI